MKATTRSIEAVAVCLVVIAGVVAAAPRVIHAQGFGGFGSGGLGGSGSYSDQGFGGEGTWASGNAPLYLPTEAALNVITIDGTAELRIKPEQIRVVLAVISEGTTAQECQEECAAQLQAVRTSWKELGIEDDNIVEDFINVLPRYEYRVTERDQTRIRIQERAGYRMQTNLHVAVKTEQEAMAAINRAFSQGVTDIVTFDYWSSELDARKEAARAQALAAAKKKAELLLTVFPERPAIINVHESSAVFFPRTLYRTFENVLEEEVEYDEWDDLPIIKAYRPKMTFFDGLQSRSDVRPPDVALRPEIAVVSTVRLYYQSPAKSANRPNVPEQ
jgi:uncharacterized protein YggE